MPPGVLPAWVERWGVPTPFPVGDVNCYYLPGRVPALIDPGPRTKEAWDALAKRIHGKRVRRVVFTHHHVDHSGLAARLKRELGVDVAAHRIDGSVLAHWGEGGEERQRDYQQGLERAGVPPDHRERMRYGGLKIESYAETVRPDHLLDEGQSLELGDRTFRILHAPGHTAGSILLQHVDEQVTFSGDTLLETITPNAVSVRASERGALADYLATLKRLQGVSLGTILPGHRNAFRDAPKVIGAALHHAQVRQDRIARQLRERPGTAWEVANRLFLRLPDHQLFLAVSETLGHLECLRRARRIRVATDGRVDRYESEAADV